jgi:hypothetical protein
MRVLVVLSALAAASSARAQEPDEVMPESEVIEGWGEARWFAGGSLDVGFLYLRPRFSSGYGVPHTLWVGLDVNPIVSVNGFGAYGGLRAAAPWIDLRVGARYYFAFTRRLLSPRDSFDLHALETVNGPGSRYLTLEAELSAAPSLGPGDLEIELAAVFVQLVDEPYYVFEETLRIIVEPPFVWDASLAYLFRFFEEGRFRIGPAVEVLHSPARGHVVVRAGALLRFRLWHDFQLRAIVMPVIYSRDDLGAEGANAFLVGFRWDFATN